MLAKAEGIEYLPSLVDRRKVFPNAASVGLSVLEYTPDWHSASEGSFVPVVGLDRPTLDKDLPAISGGYDWIVIDGAPQLRDMAVSAIKAADVVLIPVQPSPYDIWACAEARLTNLSLLAIRWPNGKPSHQHRAQRPDVTAPAVTRPRRSPQRAAGVGPVPGWPVQGRARHLRCPGAPAPVGASPHRTRARPRAREGMPAPQRRRSRSCGRRQPARQRRLTTRFGGGPCRASLSMARTEWPGARR